ncbi:MAG: hypothetical protein WA765_00430, partial [Candidatus Acidiferrum sp.]
ENFARVLHLFVKFGQHRLSNGHIGLHPKLPLSAANHRRTKGELSSFIFYAAKHRKIAHGFLPTHEIPANGR